MSTYIVVLRVAQQITTDTSPVEQNISIIEIAIRMTQEKGKANLAVLGSGKIS
jgi:hypothetical protein